MVNLLQSMPIPASLLHPDGTVFYLNHAAETLYHVDATQLIGKACHDISHPQHFTQKECPLCQAIFAKEDVRHKILYCERKKKTLEYTLHFITMNKKTYIIHFCLDVTSSISTPILSNTIPERVKLALKSFKAGMYEWDMLDNSAYVSNEWKNMLGYSIEEPFPPITLDTWKKRVHPDDIDRVMKNLQKALAAHEEYVETTHRVKHKEGHYIWILGRGLIEYDAQHTPLRMVGMHSDISEHIALQQKSTERRKILDNSLNEIYIFSAEDLKFLYLNYGAKHNVGYSFTEISELTPLDLNPNISRKDFLHILESTLNQETHTSFSSQCQRKDGSIYDVEIYLQETVFEDKKAYVAIVLDITERKKYEALIREQANSLYYLAHYDMLTDLANRVLLTERLQQAIKKAKKRQSKMALFFVDIDKFKQINDNYGHYIGDKVLKEIAQRLKKLVSHEDTIARFGGDEFVILTENIEQIETLKEKIRDLFQTPVYIETLTLHVHCSLGMSLYPDDAQSVDELLIDADKKMYLQKERDNFFKLLPGQ